MKQNTKVIILMILVFIGTTIVNYLYTNWRIETALHSQLSIQIDSAIDIVKRCDVNERNETLTILTQAKNEWIYNNYGKANELLNSVQNIVSECSSKIVYYPSFILLLLIALSVFVILVLYLFYKKT